MIAINSIPMISARLNRGGRKNCLRLIASLIRHSKPALNWAKYIIHLEPMNEQYYFGSRAMFLNTKVLLFCACTEVFFSIHLWDDENYSIPQGPFTISTFFSPDFVGTITVQDLPLQRHISDIDIHPQSVSLLFYTTGIKRHSHYGYQSKNGLRFRRTDLYTSTQVYVPFIRDKYTTIVKFIHPFLSHLRAYLSVPKTPL